MLRYILMAIMIGCWPAYADSNESDVWLQKLFDSIKFPNKTIENIKCNNIEPVDSLSLNGCYNCYNCDHEHYRRQEKAKVIKQRIRLTDDDCNSQEICCVSQSDITSTRSTENCGNTNPEGNPRRVRPTLRSVLQGQYPWRAWIYNGEEKICAATFIQQGYNVLVASAVCMYSIKDSQDLNVKFDRNNNTGSPIIRFEIHKDFEVGSRRNNIALIKLKLSLNVLHPVCLPETAAYSGTPCIMVSDDDISIHAVIPNQKECKLTDSDTMCALVPRNDYIPEFGSGLYCLDERAQKPKYLLYGIVYDNKDNMILLTNISYHSSWIINEILSLK